MSLSVQFLSLLAMIGTGIVAGAFMDIIFTGISHAGRKSFIRRRAIIIELIGWVIVGIWTFYILFNVRDGAWRLYDPLAQVSGLLLYATLFQRPCRFIGRIILRLLLKPIWFVLHLIVSFVRQIIRFIVKFMAFLLRPFVLLGRRLYKNVPKLPFKKKGK